MPSEDERLSQWVNEWWRDAYFTPLPVNHAEVEKAVATIYELIKASPPTFVWVGSPAAQVFSPGIGTAVGRIFFERDFGRQAQDNHYLFSKRLEGYDVADDRLQHYGNIFDRFRLDDDTQRYLEMYSTALSETFDDPRVNTLYSISGASVSKERWLVQLLSAVAQGWQERPNKELQHAVQVLLKSTFFVILSTPCIICERPSIVARVDGQRFRLDNPVGPAIEFPDGFSKYYLQGLEFAPEVVLCPENINPDEIMEEFNQERRRILLERYGYEAFISEVGAQSVDESKFGTLLRVEFDRGEALQMVRVVNSTPEPDGTYRKFLLRVPPWVNRAKEAVAWTFGMTEEEYNPEFQS